MSLQQDILRNFYRVMECSPLLFCHWRNMLSENNNLRSCIDEYLVKTGLQVCCIGIFPCMTTNMMITGE